MIYGHSEAIMKLWEHFDQNLALNERKEWMTKTGTQLQSFVDGAESIFI